MNNPKIIINPSKASVVIHKLKGIKSYTTSNELIYNLSGIKSFFTNQDEYEWFYSLLKKSQQISEPMKRREYGDYQTSKELSDKIISLLINKYVEPDIVFEPTFGLGSFILSSLKYFKNIKNIYGVEIYPEYYWNTKISILEYYIDNPVKKKPNIELFCADIFTYDLSYIKRNDGRILVIGNPPWITNSELSVLNSNNLPQKSNFKLLNGFDAITGKGNFDIAEFIILMMIKSFSSNDGWLSMLCKNSVIKNIIYDLKDFKYSISDITSYNIDSKYYFNVSVDASLLHCKYNNSSDDVICNVSNIENPNYVIKKYGWYNDKFVSNIDTYKDLKIFDSYSPIIWRQGVKHDCSKVMELERVNGKYKNGYGDIIDIESDLVYGLAKSSDVRNMSISNPRKYVIITQKKVGDDTKFIKDKYPKLYSYLEKNKQYFLRRKSSIYKGKSLYSIFGIGDYSFKRYKVAISGLYKSPIFSLILPENDKPMMLDDTCYFIGFDNIQDALISWVALNSTSALKLLDSLTFSDSKRPYTKDVLMRINIVDLLKYISLDYINDRIKKVNSNIFITQTQLDDYINLHNNLNIESPQYSLFEKRRSYIVK